MSNADYAIRTLAEDMPWIEKKLGADTSKKIRFLIKLMHAHHSEAVAEHPELWGTVCRVCANTKPSPETPEGGGK